MIARHEVLRTAIVVERGEPRQAILPPQPFELPLDDLSALPAEVADAQLSRRIDAVLAAPFDLQRPPLLRAQLFRLGQREHVLALALHHIAADGWSIALLVDDLMAAYRALSDGGAAPEQPPQALQYADYAVWQRAHLPGAVWERQMAYWRQQLAGSATSLTLPTRGPARPRSGARRASCARCRAPRRRRCSAAPTSTAPRCSWRCTPRSTWCSTSRRGAAISWSGRTSPTATSARRRAWSASSVNQLVLRCRVDGALRFTELLAECKRTALEAYQHQDLPFDALVSDLLPRRDADAAPFFQIKLILQNTPQRDPSSGDLSISELELSPRDVEVDLLIAVAAGDDGLRVAYDYRADVYPAAYIEQLAALYEEALRMVSEPGTRTVAELVEALSQHQKTRQQQAMEAGRAAREQQRAALGAVQRKPLAVQKPQ